MPAHDFEVTRDVGNAILHPAAVGFQLRFTFTAAHADAALLPRQVAPETRQARQQMLELSQLDLELALAGAGALGENVENERGAVEDLAIEGPLQIATLGRGKLVIKDDGIDIRLVANPGEFLRLAFADVGGRARRGQLLDAVADDFAARGGGQLRKLLQRIAQVATLPGFEFYSYEEDPFRPPVPGLDQCFQFCACITLV